MNTEVENALIQLKKLTDLYLAIFGKNSLDRVIYMAPLYCYELSSYRQYGLNSLWLLYNNFSH